MIPAIQHLEQRSYLAQISIVGDEFHIDGEVTADGTPLEGLLSNVRAVQATFDDANPATRPMWEYPDTGQWDPDRNLEEFIAALPEWRADGILAVTLNFQGGSPGQGIRGDNQAVMNSAFHPDGSMKADYLARFDLALRALDHYGMVAIVGLFYFGQDHELQNESAVLRATDNATDWLVAQNYQNVMVELVNEADNKYDHAILRTGRVDELIRRVQARSGGQLLVSASMTGGKIPSDDIIRDSDFVLLHGNGQSADKIRSMVKTVRGKTGKPIIFNEDSPKVANFKAATSVGASWGYYDQGASNYSDGFQSPAVNWTISSSAKRAFFHAVDQWSPDYAEPSSPPPSNEGVSQVYSLLLVDADDDVTIGIINHGDEIYLADYDGHALTVVAVASSATRSVRFDLNGTVRHNVDSAPLFSLNGDLDGNYHPESRISAVGSHSITAIPYRAANAIGTAGAGITVHFTVMDRISNPPPPPPPPASSSGIVRLMLVDADRDVVLGELTQGQVIRIGSLGTRNLSVLAVTTGQTASVRFAFGGKSSYRTENVAPFTLRGDGKNGRDYYAIHFINGTYTVGASAYTQRRAGGTLLNALQITFTIVN